MQQSLWLQMGHQIEEYFQQASLPQVEQTITRLNPLQSISIIQRRSLEDEVFTGDSGTGPILFTDLNRGVEVRIDPVTGYTKLNSTITHNAPVNEDINTFQLGSLVFITRLIYHYDPSAQFM